MARKQPVNDDLDLDLEEDFEVEEEDEAPASKRKSRAKSDTPRGIGARQIAEHLGADAKTFRAWLRRKVDAGEVEISEREDRSRYDFGADLNSPLAKQIIRLWGSESHERGEGLKKAQAAKAAKAASSKAKPKATKKS